MSSLLDVLPGLLPPPGETSNFMNPYSRGQTYTVVATTIIVVMLLLVTIRLYTKYFVIRKLTSDDCKSYHPILCANNKALISAQGFCLLATVNNIIIEVIVEWFLMLYSGGDYKPRVLR